MDELVFPKSEHGEISLRLDEQGELVEPQGYDKAASKTRDFLDKSKYCDCMASSRR